MALFQELELSESAMVLILLIARKIVLQIARSSPCRVLCVVCGQRPY